MTEESTSVTGPAQSVTEAATDVVPEIADEDNEAIADASKTFVITVVGAILFCIASFFILIRTRMG